MIEELRVDYDAFLRSFKRNNDIPHSILLRAGASISLGIQSAYDCIWEWKKDIYLPKKQYTQVVKSTPLVPIGLSIEDAEGNILLGYRLNNPARNTWFVPGDVIRKNEYFIDTFTRIGYGNSVFRILFCWRLRAYLQY